MKTTYAVTIGVLALMLLVFGCANKGIDNTQTQQQMQQSTATTLQSTATGDATALPDIPDNMTGDNPDAGSADDGITPDTTDVTQ